MNDAESLAKIIKDMQRRIEQLERKPGGFTKQQIIDMIYPVGCTVLQRSSSFNPNNIYGGTWTASTTSAGVAWLRTA